MYLGFWRHNARKPAPLQGVSEKCASEVSNSGIPQNVQLIAGRWPRVALTDSFDCIVVYSVMHYLESQEDAFQFVVKCLSCLNQNGRLLIADIPNADMAKRLRSSELGENVTNEYKALKMSHQSAETVTQASIFSAAEQPSPFLDDKFVLALLGDMRMRGYDAFVVPQPRELPFSYSREDILIWKRQ